MPSCVSQPKFFTLTTAFLPELVVKFTWKVSSFCCVMEVSKYRNIPEPDRQLLISGRIHPTHQNLLQFCLYQFSRTQGHREVMVQSGELSLSLTRRGWGEDRQASFGGRENLSCVLPMRHRANGCLATDRACNQPVGLVLNLQCFLPHKKH